MANTSRRALGQAALRDMRAHLVLRQISEPASDERRVDPQREIVERQLPLDVHLQLAAVLLELPRLDVAVGRQAQVDTGMRGQVLRAFRPRPFREIGWRADDRHAHVRPDAHCDHILGDLVARADARVVTFGNDVSQAVVDDQLQSRPDGIFGKGV
jgi:hypothetical protein